MEIFPNAMGENGFLHNVLSEIGKFAFQLKFQAKNLIADGLARF